MDPGRTRLALRGIMNVLQIMAIRKRPDFGGQEKP